jgi:hypothetical protein
MGVEVTHYVADHAGTFREVAIWTVATVVHCVKNTTVDRLKPIAYVR